MTTQRQAIYPDRYAVTLASGATLGCTSSAGQVVLGTISADAGKKEQRVQTPLTRAEVVQLRDWLTSFLVRTA